MRRCHIFIFFLQKLRYDYWITALPSFITTAQPRHYYYYDPAEIFNRSFEKCVTCLCPLTKEDFKLITFIWLYGIHSVLGFGSDNTKFSMLELK